jgi:hypothetical protein
VAHHAPGTDDAPALRAPDRRGRGNRTILYEWEIENDGKGHRRLAVLTIAFRKAGINYVNYERHPTEFTASLRNEEEDTAGSLPMRTFTGLTSIGICRQTISRFSRKQLTEFAEHAAGQLKERFAAGDPAVTAYFTCQGERPDGPADQAPQP